MPNYARLFSAAVEDSVRDYYRLHQSLVIPGFWLIRYGKQTPLIPALTFWCHYEPGDPDNELDQPFLSGEIAGETADPLDIFAAKERRALGEKLLPDGRALTEAQHYAWRVADLMHAREWRPRDPLANPRRRVDLTKVESLF